MFPVKGIVKLCWFKNQLSFFDLQEIFNPFDSKILIDKKELDIQREIEIINSDIDEALEFYFNSDMNDCPKFSWEE